MIDVYAVVRALAFKDRWFDIGPAGDGGYLLRMRYFEDDILTGSRDQQTTRAWYLPLDVSEAQVVQTALKCVITSQEHIAREHFKYQGERIFHPHQDIDELLRVARSSRVQSA